MILKLFELFCFWQQIIFQWRHKIIHVHARREYWYNILPRRGRILILSVFGVCLCVENGVGWFDYFCIDKSLSMCDFMIRGKKAGQIRKGNTCLDRFFLCLSRQVFPFLIWPAFFTLIMKSQIDRRWVTHRCKDIRFIQVDFQRINIPKHG